MTDRDYQLLTVCVSLEALLCVGLYRLTQYLMSQVEDTPLTRAVLAMADVFCTCIWWVNIALACIGTASYVLGAR